MHVRDPENAAVDVLCSYWGDEHQFLNCSCMCMQVLSVGRVKRGFWGSMLAGGQK